MIFKHLFIKSKTHPDISEEVLVQYTEETANELDKAHNIKIEKEINKILVAELDRELRKRINNDK